MSIAIVVLTYNRLPLLRQCTEKVIGRVSNETAEIVIWDNGSTDGTAEYLATLADPRIRVVRESTNVGMVAYGRAIAMTRSPYIVQLDDDVIDAPPDWDARLLSAFRKIPKMGWLATDLEDDPDDRVSFDRHHNDPYTPHFDHGVPLLVGATGGWCTMTSRTIYDEVGGLPTKSREVYFSTDSIFTKKIRLAGYKHGILAGVSVHHSGDRAGAEPPPLKARFHERRAVVARRKDRVKKLLLLVPGLAALNERHRWFHDPRSQ
jgi:GT2 family glycosyltransferase